MQKKMNVHTLEVVYTKKNQKIEPNLRFYADYARSGAPKPRKTKFFHKLIQKVGEDDVKMQK